jgi:hypothetical protein
MDDESGLLAVLAFDSAFLAVLHVSVELEIEFPTNRPQVADGAL